MTDRFKEQAERLAMDGLGKQWEKNVDAIATALSEAYEAGRREEREECAKVAEKEKSVWEGDLSLIAFSARKSAEDIAANIRKRAWSELYD